MRLEKLVVEVMDTQMPINNHRKLAAQQQREKELADKLKAVRERAEHARTTRRKAEQEQRLNEPAAEVEVSE